MRSLQSPQTLLRADQSGIVWGPNMIEELEGQTTALRNKESEGQATALVNKESVGRFLEINILVNLYFIGYPEIWRGSFDDETKALILKKVLRNAQAR